MSIAEESKALYGPFLSAEDRAIVDAMDYPDQVYFWTLLYYELPSHLSKSILKDMEREVINGTARLRTVFKRAKDVEAKRLDEVWDTIKPHAWFKTTVS